MKTTLRLALSLLAGLLGGYSPAWAEGSRELTPNTAATAGVALNNNTNTRSGWLEHDANFANNAAAGNASRGFLKPFGYNYNGVVFSEDHRLYIRVKAGEYLYYGIHRINNVNNTGNQNDVILTLKYGAGAGTQVQQTTLTRNTATANTGAPIWQSLLNAQRGVIDNAAQNRFGPSITAGDGGYNPLVYQNTTGADQDFYIEFTQVNETALDERNRFSTYDFWDFTVRTTNTAAGVERKGRLYSKQWAFSAGADNGVFSSTFSMFPMIPSTKEPGKVFVKKFDLAGLNPQNYFRFTTNSRGTTASATDFSVSRRSQTTLADFPEYSSYVNDPDNTIWPSATDPTFAVNNITPYCGGANGGLVFTTTSSEAGQLIITLNLDGVAGYQAGGRDVFIEQSVPAGKSSVAWNGRDGLNNAVAQNTSIDIAFKSSVAPLNFPMVDAENNVDGFVVNSVRPGTTFNLLFWDDTNLDATRFPAANTRVEANGQNSSGGVHRWGATTGALLDAGNQYTVNTYTYVTINTASQTVAYRYVCDKDADGVADNVDIDKDNDGITDTNESNGVNPLALTAAGVPTYLDAVYVNPTYGAFRDANNDGINDVFDFDLDGIPNFLDIDADDDGIPDAIEANGGAAPTGYDASLSRFPSTNVGTNGMPDVAETTAGNGISRLANPNNDGVGRPDFLDIDADDDGIVDNVEAQTTAGFRAPTGVDTDGDGLDDRYDLTPGTGVAAGAAVTLPNSEPATAGIDTFPDYIDNNSDNDGRNDAREAWDLNNDGTIDINYSGVDADGDGLDDVYDTNVSTGSFDATNGGKTPQFYPDVQNPGGDRDWRQNTPPVALNITSQPIPNSAAATAIPALSGSDADGLANSSNLTYTLVTVPNTLTEGTLTFLNASNVRVTATAGATVPLANIGTLQFDPVVTYTGNLTFTYRVTESVATGGQVSNTATYTIPVGPTTSLSGTVFDDVNYGGGAGRTLNTATTSANGSGLTIGRSGATVELYDAQGNYVATTTTGTNGAYTFSGIVGNAAGIGYQTRVVNSTVTSARNSANVGGLIGVQTLAYTNVNRVGGENPNLADAPARTAGQDLSDLTTATATPQSLAAVTVNLLPVTGVDFGFNFDVVTNTNDSGQGSLRQFITNSNALPNTGLDQAAFNGTPATGTTATNPAAGIEAAIFMMNDGRTTGTAPAGLRLNMTAPLGYNATTGFTTTLTTALPSITDSRTTIDGNFQAEVTGNKVAAVAGSTTGAEVTIDFNERAGLFVTGGNTTIASLTLTGAQGNSFNSGIPNPAPISSEGSGVTFSGAAATGSIVTDVTATDNATAGVRLQAGATGVTVSSNVLTSSRTSLGGFNFRAFDGVGIALNDASTNTITGNSVSGNNGFGIEVTTTSGSSNTNTISLNTITGNGIGTNTTNDAGISIQAGNNNLVLSNTITGNAGDGIMAMAGTSGNRFSQNSTSGNNGNGITGNLGIDLSADNTVANGDGVTLNADGKSATSGANGLLNFPVFTQAVINGSNLTVTGYARPGAVLEFFVASADPTNFGEGASYLFSRTEGSTEDGDARRGNYSGVMGNMGLNQGSENGSYRFVFTIPVSSTQVTQLLAGKLTATATIPATVNGLAVGNTSEFSGIITVLNNTPLPVELTQFTAKAVQNSTQLSWATASEKDNAYFVVERSFDGATFQTISKVAGSGAGINAGRSYSFTDQNVGTKHQGAVYYRLEQVDTDGSSSNSIVRVVNFTTNVVATVSLYPNPTTSTTTLDLTTLPAGAYQVTLADMTGRTLSTRSYEGGAQYSLDLTSLPQGMYLVTVQGQQVKITQQLSKK
ncbi:beta strand repeat-containing protein [Hymenobacter cellulosivorans]|uniref:Right-handed parallel beta-helix repeat-containing protein n=1 Tax=Hymenobacter cellulosivorans TaxID=2932249 RepID=A0ABY4FBQ0_9BACT|nr:right-handed parallel beta-helix repeat-containing protein [Hymenobacter cellulosivorans]UOQ53923.1 right-handed parallel beta-helix repeat-containing protein [Hymenobacter cellulosivorans]